MTRRAVIESVTPSIDCGRYPAKRTVGERCVVEADIFRDGHDLIRAVLKWRRRREGRFAEAPMAPMANDRWRGEFPLEENTRYVFAIEAWTDHFASWAAAVRKKIEAGQPIAVDVAEGVALIGAVRERAAGEDRRPLEEFMAALGAAARRPRVVSAILAEPELEEIMTRLDGRADATVTDPPFDVVVDRKLARFSTWYEFFPRSQGTEAGKHGTFCDAERRLPDIRDMGFDVLYLPPIHPIGLTNRKGPNNTPSTDPADPGSPWAIGSEAGGHTAVEPSLGTLDDFDRFVAVANRLGIEIALDFAIQCSPDHPYVKEHPDWFFQRPDGTIRTAENPPKKYEDVCAVNFDTEDREALWDELRRVVLFWIDRGVKVFRVDNPHTKPIAFWHWLIQDVKERHPEVIFLSEAFTRPKVMKALAKAGFTQSYTYFTWRNTKHELTEYMTELTNSEQREFFQPSFWPNTPDILPPILQTGGRPAFKMRLVLAATLSPSYGIYSGFELCENEALPGREEYLHSEKYEIKVRDWDRPGNIKDYVARVNAIRRDNPALQELLNLRFFHIDSDQILFYGKMTPDRSNVILVAVNLDPFHVHEGTTWIPPDDIGVPRGGRFEVRDLLTGATFDWGEANFVRLDPIVEPAHILRVERHL